MKTRKQLQAENAELRQQLVVHGHQTRKALMARLKESERRNKTWEAAMPRHARSMEELQAKLTAAEEALTLAEEKLTSIAAPYVSEGRMVMDEPLDDIPL